MTLDVANVVFFSLFIIWLCNSRFITLLMIIVIAAASPVMAHEATHWETGKGMGWHYDKERCCDGTDCAMLRPTAVVRTKTGYTVTVEIGEHPMLMRKHTFTFAHDAPEIRVSGDEFYHLCTSNDGYEVGQFGRPNVFCFYVPMILGDRVLSHVNKG